MKEYNKNNTKKAQYLRKNATPWERKLWYEFLKDYPIRFQRQKPIDNFVADFYCAKAGIVLELDGGEHFSSQTLQYDQMRTEILQKKGVKVVRICNNEIDKNFEGVCEYIDDIVKQNLKSR
ncbi:MAG: endonuclease domain-containing protein [Clostridia bacterium]|nr:endonuclease domain-containing protein [Clostridia bacterium]